MLAKEPTSLRFAVVGGGITGLSAAHRLVELGREQSLPVTVSLLEASERVGGHVRTERVGEYLLEAGPDSILARKPAAERLCGRLGLGGEIVALGKPDATLEVVRRGRLVPLPEGFSLMAPRSLAPTLCSSLFSVRGKLRMLREPWIAARPEGVDDESVASFVCRRFGREVLERVVEPIVGGLYTARVEELSLRLTLAQFLDMEREQGSVLRGVRRVGAASRGAGPSGFLSLRTGLEALVERLSASLPAGSIRRHAPVTSLRRDPIATAFRIEDSHGRTIDADAVVLACPAHVSARILRRADPDLASRLDQLDYASCATVTLGYPRKAQGAARRSHGFFVPRSERLPILACSYVSAKFEGRAPADALVLRAFLGGATRPEILEQDDEALVRQTQETLARLLQIRGRPDLVRVHRFPRSMPQYRVGQAALIAELKERADRHPGLQLAGSSVGAKGLPECIQSGEEAAERALLLLSARGEALRQAI